MMVESEDIFALSALERLRRYRELAGEAVHQARLARTPDIRDGYRLIARHWAEIASLLERAMRLKGIVRIPDWQPPADDAEP